MKKTTVISVNISIELKEALEKLAVKEERSKSYYIKKGIEKILAEKGVNVNKAKKGKK